MIIKGIEIAERPIQVQVMNRDLINAVITLLGKKYPVIDQFDHIDKDGWLMKFSSMDPHRGDVDYDQVRKATDIEKFAFSIKNELDSLKWVKE